MSSPESSQLPGLHREREGGRDTYGGIDGDLQPVSRPLDENIMPKFHKRGRVEM